MVSGFVPCEGVAILGATADVFMRVARRIEFELRADGGPEGGCGCIGGGIGSRADRLPDGGRFSSLFARGRALADMLPDAGGRLSAIFSRVEEAMDDADGDLCGLTVPGGGRPCRDGEREGGRCCLEGEREGGREERDGDGAALGRR